MVLSFKTFGGKKKEILKVESKNNSLFRGIIEEFKENQLKRQREIKSTIVVDDVKIEHIQSGNASVVQSLPMENYESLTRLAKIIIEDDDIDDELISETQQVLENEIEILEKKEETDKNVSHVVATEEINTSDALSIIKILAEQIENILNNQKPPIVNVNIPDAQVTHTPRTKLVERDDKGFISKIIET